MHSDGKLRFTARLPGLHPFPLTCKMEIMIVLLHSTAEKIVFIVI